MQVLAITQKEDNLVLKFYIGAYKIIFTTYLLTMYKTLFLVFIIGVSACNNSEKPGATQFTEQDKKAIVTALHKSANDWNNADLDAFMSLTIARLRL